MRQLLNLRENKKNRLIALILTLGICLGVAFGKISANNSTTQSFDQDVNLIKGTNTEQEVLQLVKKKNFIGTVTLVKNGHLVYQKGFGYANKAQKIKNSGKTTFQIASIQKGMTAMMLMKVALANHFSLDTKLSQFYPQIKNANNVTLRNLLTMTSGILDEKLPFHAMSDQQFVNYTVKHTKIIKSHIGNFQYQPVNFVLAAGIIQKESKLSYYEYFNKVIKKPLGLKNTYFYQEISQHKKQKAQGYTFSKKNPYKVRYEPTSGYTNQLGTGNLYMSNGDLYQTLHAFLSAKLLTPTQTADLYSSGKTNSKYVSGLYILSRKFPGMASTKYEGYHFHGAEFGFETVGDISKDGQTAVIFSSNSVNWDANNNYSMDIPVYKKLINDKKIFRNFD